jgi:predicted nucleic acid-binding protein
MTSVSVAFLVDTNILVYIHDPRDAEKQRRAYTVVNLLIDNERAVLSAQCLTEFFNTVTRRLPEPLPTAVAIAQVERLARACRVLPLTPSVVLEGCRGSVQFQMSVWDALIWAVAKLNQVPFVLSEDFQDGRVLEGVRFLNPLADTFDLAALERMS